MRDVRVLHIGLSSNKGGIETVVHSWLKYKPDWLHFDFIQIGDSHIAFEEDFIKSGAMIYKITARSKNISKSNSELKRIIEKGNYDFVQHHIMSFSWPEPILITLKNSNSKAVLHAHTVITNRFSLKYKALHVFGKSRLRNAKYLKVACSDEAGKAMFKEGYRIIKNGISFEDCGYDSLDRELIRNKLGVKKGDKIVGHVGRSAFEKNYPYLLKVFKQIKNIDNDVKLLLIGDILEDKCIQSDIDMLGIRQDVICTGKVDNVSAYYSAMDLFFLPSIIEGVSVSLLEAQASGLPCVISSNVSKEAIISDSCSYCSLSDEKTVAQSIVAVLNKNNGERRNIHLSGDYDLNKTSADMYSFYLRNMES